MYVFGNKILPIVVVSAACKVSKIQNQATETVNPEKLVNILLENTS